jgi:hypothetical protein
MKRESGSSKVRARRWTAAEARAVLDDLARSGLPAARFAARRGFGVERLYWWLRREARRQAKAEAKAPGFREITLTPAAATVAIELVLPDGIALRLAGASRVDDALAILSRLPGR